MALPANCLQSHRRPVSLFSLWAEVSLVYWLVSSAGARGMTCEFLKEVLRDYYQVNQFTSLYNFELSSCLIQISVGDGFTIGTSAIRALQKWPEMAEENERISYEPWTSWHKITGEMISGPKPFELNPSGGTAGDQNTQSPRIYRHSRPRMHKMLSDQIERIGITVEYGKRVAKYYEDLGCSTAGVILESGERLEADVIIAADGIGSTSSLITLGHAVRARPTGFSIYRASCPIGETLTDPVFEEKFPILENDRPSAQLWMGFVPVSSSPSS